MSATKYTGAPSVSESVQNIPQQLSPNAGVPEPAASVDLIGPDGKPTREGWRKIGENFQKQMDHKQKKGPAGTLLDYVTARQVAERLDKVVGPGNWRTLFEVIDLERHVVKCSLIIFDMVKQDVGYPNSDGSQYETEPFKAAFSDAFKRAACQWGVGRYLYHET